MAGKKVFLCFAAEDQFRLPPLLAAFTAWDLSPAVLAPQQQPSGQLLAETATQIRDCDLYLRLCTGATRRSPQVALADATFRKLLGRSAKRKLVNLILDTTYVPDAQDKATLYIDTAGKTRALWLEELAVPLGVATLKQRISRRALFGMGVGAALTVVSSGVAATILLQQAEQQAQAGKVIPNTAGLSGQPRWIIPLGSFSDQSGADTTLFNDNGAYYAAVSGSTSVGLFTLSFLNKTAKFITLPITSLDLNAPPISVAGGLIFVGYLDANGNPLRSAFRVSDGSLAFHFDAPLYSTPYVAGEYFYCIVASTAGDTSVAAFDLRSGALRWQHPIAWNGYNDNILGFTNPLIVADGALYAYAFDHTMTCYDAITGKQKWQFLARGQMTVPVIVDGVLYAGVRDGSIYALDAATGTKRWQAKTGAGIVAPPAVSDGAVYVGSIEGFLSAYDANTGAPFWSSLLGGVETNLTAFEIDIAPAVYRNVIVVTSSGVLFAYDLRTGKARWQYQSIPQGSDSISPPMVYQGLFLFGSPDGKVYAVNP